jgi:hypothetical protein
MKARPLVQGSRAWLRPAPVFGPTIIAVFRIPGLDEAGEMNLVESAARRPTQ